MPHPPAELDVEPEVIAFHNAMLHKGKSFYGVAVQPPKGKEKEVKGQLEGILRNRGFEVVLSHIDGYLAFQGEYPAEVMEEVRQYLTSIEHLTPNPPVMKRGDYFQMLAYKWLDGTATRYKFNGKLG